MGNKSRTKPNRATTAASSRVGDVPVVGGREPCPCGSGRRYKACHGRAHRETTAFVGRPFAGLAGERDWVALREFVPAATARLTLAGDTTTGADTRTATAATLLPMVWAGVVGADGNPVIGLQVPGGSGDPSRDYAAVLARLLELDPGASIDSVGLPGDGPRLQDLLDPQAPFEPELHETFEFWDAVAAADESGLVAASRERADAAITPTARLRSVEGAYWCRAAGDRDYLRWVRREAEDALVDALARLHVRGQDLMGEGSRQVGAFRAHGLLVFVWDLPAGSEPAALDEPAAAFDAHLAEALATGAPLSPPERSARAGLVNRQRTLR